MKQLFIYGAGGLGREILSLVRALPEWMPKGFLDDTVEPGTIVSGLPVVGGLASVSRLGKDSWMVIAIGDPAIKTTAVDKLAEFKPRYATLVHPSAILQDASTISVGEGAIIGAGCVLTTDISIGPHALINLNVTIGHNSLIGRCASLMPGVNISGNVHLGESVMIGAGANIINNVTVGKGTRVGAGAVVIDNLPADATAVGVPAKIVNP